jgi:hypothetical protein
MIIFLGEISFLREKEELGGPQSVGAATGQNQWLYLPIDPDIYW